MASLRTKLSELGVEAETLDSIVLDGATRLATRANNDGVKEQLRFLENEVGMTESEILIAVSESLGVLIPWIVLYTDKTFNVPEASLHQASDSDHAQEMFLADNPNATVVWIVQTDDVNKAYDDYHNSEE